MSQIDLRQIARLARLHLTPEEMARLEPQLANILTFVEELKAVNVDGVEPTSHPLSLSNVFREDSPKPSLDIQAFLKHAPLAHGRFFEVPKIIEDNS